MLFNAPQANMKRPLLNVPLSHSMMRPSVNHLVHCLPAGLEFPAVQSPHAQRIRHQSALHVWLNAQTLHLAAEQVQHHGQVQPAFFSRNVGDVTGPHLIGRVGREVALQQVLCNGPVVPAVGGDDKLSFAPGLNGVLFHHEAHALLTQANAACHQFLPHLGPAIFLFDLGVDGTDESEQGFIADALVGTRLRWLAYAFAPHVLKATAGAHTQHLAGQRCRSMLFVAGYPGALHFGTRAKFAVAFPRMSRAIRSRAFSARSLASSICSGLTGLSPGPLS